MLIPPNEILDNHFHYHFKAETEIALLHQIKKLCFFCKKLETILDKNRLTHYIAEEECSYYVESIINNHSTLIEYYYSWIIISLIGTISPSEKIIYKPIKEIEKEKQIEQIFKKHSIGVLVKTNTDEKQYLDKCKNLFLEAFSFIFIGKNHEIYVLNNYLKHNRMPFDYAPKTVYEENPISVPFLYIHDECKSLLQESIIKELFNTDPKTTTDSRNQFREIINEKSQKLHEMGNIKIIKINDIEYVQCRSFSGITIESILKTVYSLINDIFSIQKKYQKGEITLMQKIEKIEILIKERKPKTLS
ncbi:hypothetical protein [Pectobacterium brasiliense]|uniref:hypothetical protein n=1 Tax=Pectobacterium brasiliense TaxID=180957 RepID=UPI0019D392E6|nr:hypothetical protein [Pectobacterium brasiliense]MBN7764361.1 hypothetical protein [Pectobacterium brasiliense]